MSTSPLRVAIVGFGVTGPLHALAYRMLPVVFPSLRRSAELVLVVDPADSARQRAHSELGVLVTRPGTDIFERYGIEAIDCCAPTEQHGEICSAAVNRGLAVLCEKPLTGIAETSRQLVSLVSNSGVCFCINFNFRFVPALQEARRRVAAGVLGELKSFRVEYHRSSNIARWRSGSWSDRSPQRGALMDLGPHAIDMVHFLFGPIRALSARKLHYSTQADATTPDDIAKLDIRLENNASGSIEVSKITPGSANDLTVFAYGTEGALRFSMDNPNVLDVFGCASDWRVQERSRLNSSGSTPRVSVIPPETPTGVLMWHAASIASFVESAVDGTVPTASIRDGLGVDLAISSALRSSANNSESVAVEPW